MKKILILFFFLCSFLSQAQEKEVYFYKKGSAAPVIFLASYSNDLLNPLSFFQKEILRKYGLRINFSSKKRNGVVNVRFRVNEGASNDKYKVDFVSNELTIVASTERGFKLAITYLVNDVLSADKKENIKIGKLIEQNTSVASSPGLEYREVYFSSNFDAKVREEYKTNYLEIEWGLWGHNISKWVAKESHTDEIFALVKGKRHKHQFCFSSPELENIIHKNVKQIQSQDASLTKFMVAPADNNLVCECKLCKTKGNFKGNATPAVYSLLGKLAKKYTDLTFWSLGYVTTKKPPMFKLPENVGVLLSTIDCQEGIPLQDTSKGKKFLKEISDWKSKIQNIYIWDYVVNFDNYMDFYPIYTTTSKNINSYIDNGVTGVFLHGSEYDYSILQDVKHHVLASLLWDPSASVEKLIDEATEKYYPAVSKSLSKYLKSIEFEAGRTQRKQNIYSGIYQAKKRYLNLEGLEELGIALQKATPTESLNKLKLGLLFLELEMMRTNGLKNNGYATLKANDIRILSKVDFRISQLEQLVKNTGIKKINEKGETFDAYLKQWQGFIKRVKTNPLFYNTSISTRSTLDEDYNRIKVLNDGAFGFEDYNNNWMIFSGKELLIDVNNFKCHDKGLKKIELSFLCDTKHKIHLPTVVQILENGKVLKEIKLSDKQAVKCQVKVVDFSVPLTSKKYSYTIRLQNDYKSIAIDEIRFLR